MGVAIGGIGDESFLRLAHNTGNERVKALEGQISNIGFLCVMHY